MKLSTNLFGSANTVKRERINSLKTFIDFSAIEDVDENVEITKTPAALSLIVYQLVKGLKSWKSENGLVIWK